MLPTKIKQKWRPFQIMRLFKDTLYNLYEPLHSKTAPVLIIVRFFSH